MGFSIGSNNANYNNCASWGFPSPVPNLTTVGTNGGPSYYGTYDQSGNVVEWNDLDGTPGSSRGLRGGGWESQAFGLSSSSRQTSSAEGSNGGWSFRIASSTNPLNLSYFLNVIDTGNTNDPLTGYGTVNYTYKIGKYVVTNCEYVSFLNAVAKTDSFGLYSSNMSADYSYGGIIKTGTSGNFSYSIKTNMSNKPVVGISWFHAARYCNWLHNGRPFGSQNNNTTEDGAYTLNGIISGNAVAKNNNALYWIPTENEWYKAAYYKGGSTNAGYWAFATQSDAVPVCVTASSIGDGLGNQICNYNSCAVWNGANGNVTTVGSNGLSSYYGADDMNGNVWEWTDTIVSTSTRVLRGGNYSYNFNYLISTTRNYSSETSASSLIGFRVMSRTNYFGYLDMVLVGDENNYADTNGYGSVWYSYYVGKYPVTNNQYLEFLNSVAVTDTNGLYNTNMGLSNIGGILRSGSNGSYVYTLKSSIWANKPVSFVSWQNAARFCNWLSYGKPTGLQSSSTTELRAYDVSSSIGRLGNNNSLWYYLCSENEWYKAAYYKGGNDNAGYWSYATQSNTAPQCVSSNSTGDGPYDNTQIFSCVLAVPTPTPTTTPTITPTPSLTNTGTPSSSLTPTITPTNTPTPTISATKTSTPTPTRQNSLTPTPTSTVTKTPTKTSTPNTTPSVTATMTNTPTVSPTKNIYTRYHKTNISNFNSKLNSLNISCADFCMPNNFKAYTINTSAFLSWTTNNDCNNLIKQYDVYYKNINSNIWILHSNLPSTARTVTISNLTSYNSYIFKLSAIKQDNSILGNVCSNITVPGMTPFATRTPTKTPINTPSSTSPGLSFSATPTPTTTPPICVPGSGNTMILNFENSLYDSGSAGMCMIAYPDLSSVISSDQKKSGNYSAKLSGSKFIYSNPNSFFAFGTDDFVIETWLYQSDWSDGAVTLYDGFNIDNPNISRPDCFVWQLYKDSYSYFLTVTPDQNTSLIYYNDTQYWFNSSSGYTIPLNTWVKHSLVRQNGHFYWYVNDSLVGSTLVDPWDPRIFDGINENLPLLNITSEYSTIGNIRDNFGMNPLNGYLDEFKIIKGQP